MKPIIDPVDVELLEAELAPQYFLRKTNRANNELYVITGNTAPNVMREIGRLREIAFRDGGGGTGEALDVDKFDTDPAYGYRQLVLWDPEARKIVGGYRLAFCSDAVYTATGQPILTSSHMFEFSRKFIKDYLPQTVELGRSFVAPEYQSTKAGSKSIYALDNLMDGLMTLMAAYSDKVHYLFGKVTIYKDYPRDGVDLILSFLKKYFGRKEKMVRRRIPVKVENPARAAKLFRGNTYKENYRILTAELKKMGLHIPPLINTYMNLSPDMIYFGTGINDEFSDVYDSAMLVDFRSIYPEKKARHLDSLSEPLEKTRTRVERMRLSFHQLGRFFTLGSAKDRPVDMSDDSDLDEEAARLSGGMDIS